MSPHLRSAIEADIPHIAALAHRIWWAHYPDIIGGQQVEYMLGLLYTPGALLRQMAEGQIFYLIENEGDTLGFLAVSDKGEGRYFLHKFYLDPEKQGHGLGKKTFDQMLARYPDLREMRLTVNRQNFKSINFYFKIGFRIEHCVDIPIGEGFVMDDFQMLFTK